MESDCQYPAEYFPADLYHGTDLKTLRLSAEERSNMANACNIVAGISYEILSRNEIRTSADYSKIKALMGNDWRNLCELGLRPYSARQSRNADYQYESLYVATQRNLAESFARKSFVFGEQGNVAYWLYTAAKRLADPEKTVTSEKELNTFSLFLQAMAKPKQPTIVVLEKDMVPIRFLRLNNGADVSWNSSWEDFKNGSLGLSLQIDKSSGIELTNGKIIPL